MVRIRSLAAVLGISLLAACGGDDPTGVGDDGDGREIITDPSFSGDINEVFIRNGCTASNCHGGGQGGLTLTSTTANNYAQLVGVTSTSEPAVARVTPNDAENSYLIIKVEGRQSVGGRMPLGGAPLDNIDITNLRNWINNGARDN